MRQLSLLQRIIKAAKMALHPAEEKLICKAPGALSNAMKETREAGGGIKSKNGMRRGA